MLYYPPKNRDYSELGEAPPLLCKSHGGPTAATSATFNLSIQYWTRWVACLQPTGLFPSRRRPYESSEQRAGAESAESTVDSGLCRPLTAIILV